MPLAAYMESLFYVNIDQFEAPASLQAGQKHLAKSRFLPALLVPSFSSARVGAAQSLVIVQDFIAVIINDYLH